MRISILTLISNTLSSPCTFLYEATDKKDFALRALICLPSALFSRRQPFQIPFKFLCVFEPIHCLCQSPYRKTYPPRFQMPAVFSYHFPTLSVFLRFLQFCLSGRQRQGKGIYRRLFHNLEFIALRNTELFYNFRRYGYLGTSSDFR